MSHQIIFKSSVSAKLSKPTGQKISKVRKQQKKKIQFCQSYSYVNRKVWYHQIWIPSNLYFIVSDLMYMAPRTVSYTKLCLYFLQIHTTMYFYRFCQRICYSHHGNIIGRLERIILWPIMTGVWNCGHKRPFLTA